MIIRGEIEEKFEEYGDAKGYSEDDQDDPEGVLHPNNLVKTPHSSKPANWLQYVELLSPTFLYQIY